MEDYSLGLSATVVFPRDIGERARGMEFNSSGGENASILDTTRSSLRFDRPEL